jgi:hypothetical protein
MSISLNDYFLSSQNVLPKVFDNLEEANEEIIRDRDVLKENLV